MTVVEKASKVREGGQAVDFKGATHRTVLESMGILEDVRKARVISGGDGLIVNANGRKIGSVPAAFSGGEIEILRGDLARILFERTKRTCEYIFSDSVASLNETPVGVEVTFERSRRVSLILSSVRMAFIPMCVGWPSDRRRIALRAARLEETLAKPFSAFMSDLVTLD